ncbi:MAG: (Fe-S)-binding protein [Desulfobulbaceae bacterium]|nr:(Fe-S)-binding protein [Desulfobulbaceae bacterium]
MIIDSEKLSSLIKRCAKCGACTAVCPVYRITGRESDTPRGRIHLLSKLTHPRASALGAIFSQCLLCGACLDACPRKIDTLSLVVKTREIIPAQAHPHFIEKFLARKTLSSPALLSRLGKMRHILLESLPETSGLRHKLALLPQDFTPSRPISGYTSADDKTGPVAINYFSGCLARYLSHDIASATRFLAEKTTGKKTDMPESQACCGLAAHAAGSLKQAKDLARQNIAAFTDTDSPILTSCASCYSHLKSYPDLLADDPEWKGRAQDFSARLVEFSTFFVHHLSLQHDICRMSQEKTDQKRIFYHDPCHLRFGPIKIKDAPRQLIAMMTGSPPMELKQGASCCGQGGLFSVAHPHLSEQIFSQSLSDFLELSADMVVTTCSGCLLQWQKGLKKDKKTSSVQADHLAVFLAELIKS